MARPSDPALKRALLDQVVGYLGEHGLGMVSLRPMAAALAVSTNRLVHHLGSKDELIAASLDRAIEIQEDVRSAWLDHDPDLSQPELLRQWWRWINAAPANLALVRLGLEAVTIDATASGIAGEVRAQQVGVWRSSIEERLVKDGLSRHEAEIEASIAKGVFTGLVVDLLASGDVDRLGRALDGYLVGLEQRLGLERRRAQRANDPDRAADRAVVRSVSDVEVERWDDPARGPVTWQTLLSGDRTPTSGLTVGIAELPAGSGHDDPPHRHEPPELYFILDGEGIVEIDGQAQPVGADAVVFVPAMAAHRLVNTGDAALRLLYAFPVDSFADVVYLFPTA
jgi:mannose-6-phosphate isomerase-like protein (cupin superfamily)